MLVPETEIIVTKDGAEILRKTVRPGDYVIGREPGCEVRLDVELVSRRHAQLIVNFDHALVEDLGSSNGTFINGQPVTEPTRLWPNQKIQVGAATVELRRIKTASPPDVSLAPQTAAVQRLLPEELLHDKKYDIGKMIAQGGMGAILDVRDAATQRRVAMKVMLDGSSPEDLSRFVAEARVTSQLEHPSIVPVHELSVDENGQPFYTMKMVRGITLRKVLELLAEGVPETVKKYPLPALLTIFQKVCDALAFAHSKGVIHRDLKPENIMLDDFGVVLVMDWGLAKVLGGHRSVDAMVHGADGAAPSIASVNRAEPEFGGTMAGAIMGTPQYMSPEQARGEVEDLDARSDIYALGAILYHILALRPPVSGHTAMEVVDKVGRGEIEPLVVGRVSARAKAAPAGGDTRPAPTGGRIPDSLAAVVRKAMDFDKARRYPRVEDIQRDITAYQTGFATSAEKAGAWKQFKLFVARNKAASLGVAAVLLIGSVLGAKAVIEGRRASLALAALKKTAPTLLALAGSEADFQRFDSALEKLDGALALDPALVEAHWQRAWVLLGQQRWSEAAATVRLAKQKDPAHGDRADILPQVERLSAAKSEAERDGSAEARAIVSRLQSVAAHGPATTLVNQLKLGREASLAVVRQRVTQWLGTQNAGRVSFGYRGFSGIAVDLSKLPITTIEPLAGLPIENFILDESKVASLEGVGGMPLRRLSMRTTTITDLHPLAGLPLEVIYMNNSKVSDLSPLRGALLNTLGLDRTNVSDLSPLRGSPLKDLTLSYSLVRDLGPLAGAPLRDLSIEGLDVADLSPLRGMALNKLVLRGIRANDLSPLRGMPLRELDIINCSAAIDLAILFELPDLEKLWIDDKNPSLEKLRRHPKLRLIRFSRTGQPPPNDYEPIEQFWKDYDARRPTPPK